MCNKKIWALFLCLCMAGCGVDGESPEGEKALIVQPETVINLQENGISGDFVVKLNVRPSAPVTINLKTTQNGVVAFSETSVTIRPDDWNYGKSIRVSCLNDDVLGDRYVTVVFTTSSVDSTYANLAETRTLVCEDNDKNGVVDSNTPPQNTDPNENNPSPENPVNHEEIVVPESASGKVNVDVSDILETSEDGQTAVFSVSLETQPSENVLVFVKSHDESEGVASPSVLTFTSSNWNRRQQVTLTGVDDEVLDGDVEYQVSLTTMSGDDAYGDIDDIYLNVKNLDNEKRTLIPTGPVSVLVSPVAGLKTTEKGGAATFDVSLSAKPSSDVHISVQSSDETEGKTDVSELIFTNFNWSAAQTVTVIGQDDSEPDGDVAYSIHLGPVVSDDLRYQGLNVMGVRVTNLDNDPPDIPVSITVSKQTLEIEESGAPGTFKVCLDEKPIADVQIALSVSDDTEGMVSPSLLTFTESNWNTPQTVMVSGVVDGIEDGSQTFNVLFNVTSEDSRYDEYSLLPVIVTSVDSDVHTGTTVNLRIMAANISSGNFQAYSPGHGVRIFQAVKPDIVLIQEFNWNATGDSDAVVQELVTTAFGDDYVFSRGVGSIPNGVISRYPIISEGSWPSNKINNRQWNWAVVDLPGPKELLLVSVHLSTDKNGAEIPVLMEKIQEKLNEDAKLGNSYFVMIGGDFNTSSRNVVIDNMSSIFTTSAPYPMDQNGNTYTNAHRKEPYDYLLCSPDWCAFEVPVEIGTHTGLNAYKNGHIFDSRVYGKTSVGAGTELDYVPPVKKDDSAAENMQHMAVIRDFKYTY